MNTDIKAVQIIVSLLKQNNICHIVISPGTRHVPLVHCVEMDSFFKCYSIVDERSAAYFALGLSEELDEPVCFTCTSSTASCNYMPAMQEAYEKGIQLVALTSDKGRYLRYHGLSQSIDQVDMYTPYCKYAVDTPIVNNSDDYWYCNRLVNEALLELNHHGKGPVQINFLEPLSIMKLSEFKDGDIPTTRKISRIEGSINWKQWVDYLKNKKRILVICGQYYNDNDKLSMSLQKFFESYNCVITYDNFSNIHGEGFFLSPLVCQTMNYNEIAQTLPDLVITYGSKVYSDIMNCVSGKGIEQWDINPEGRLYDSTKSLKYIFECKPQTFFESVSNVNQKNDLSYYNLWANIGASRSNDISVYSNYYVAKNVIDSAPAGTLIHASVLNSMKFTNYCNLKDGTIAFGNISADGIDGALSTFMGQAAVWKGISLLVIGDLSFLYDLNAFKNCTNPNFRILLINNKAGGEFHYNISKKRIDTLDRHIAAAHHSVFENVMDLGCVKYMHASNKEELKNTIVEFYKASDKPIVLEVFTDANSDGENLRQFLGSNTLATRRAKLSKVIQGLLGENIMNLLKKNLNGLRKH